MKCIPFRTALCVMLGIAGLIIAGCTDQGTPSADPTTISAPATSATSAPPTGNTPPSTPGTPGTPGATGSEAPSAPPGGPGRCTAGVLQATVQPKDSAAGNRYAELVVTNKGSAPCTLYGYGGLQLFDFDGQPMPTTALRDEPPAPSLVTVQPGASAAKLLHWGVVPTGDEPADKPCQPTPAKLGVIPPDETQQFTVPWDLGPVCAAGTIHGSAYYAP